MRLIPSMLLCSVALLSCGPKKAPEVNAVSAEDVLPPMPEVGSPGAWAPPVPEVLTLEEVGDGVPVWFVHQPGVPLVSVRLILQGGSATDPEGRQGLTQLTDTLLGHGAGDRDAVAFAEEVERLAISLDTGTGSLTSQVGLDCKADVLPEGLALMADLVLRPHLAEEELDRVRDIQLGDIMQLTDSPRSMGRLEARRLWFGEGHPMAHPSMGTEKEVNAITAADAQASWSSRFQPAKAAFVVTGDVGPSELMGLLGEAFADWSGTAAAPVEYPPPAGVDQGMSLHLMHKAGASQSSIYLVLPGWTLDDPELPPARLATIALGGTFTSRLNRLLREEKGYTYGARAWTESGPGYGMLWVGTSVQADVTGPAMNDLLGVMKKWPEGLEEDEVAKAVGAWRTGLIESMDSRAGTAGSFAEELSFGAAPDSLSTQLQAALAADVAQVNAAVAGVSLDGALLVVVGDADLIEAPLKEVVPGDWKVTR